MALADHCCGSAGVYNVTQTEASLALLAEKMHHARATGAQAIVTANPGCLLQLRAGAEIHHTGQEVLHVVELLARAIGGPLLIESQPYPKLLMKWRAALPRGCPKDIFSL